MHDDQATAAEYDDPMCSKLLGTAADVLRSFGSAFGGRHLAIVGGAVPSLLVGRLPARLHPHVGTADLDFHLSLHLLDGETADYYQAIIDGLRSLGLRTDSQGGREVKWRWVGRHRGARVQVEFLCPMRDRAGHPEKPASGTPAEANIGPAGEITALAVGYGHLVPRDTVYVERRVMTSDGMLGYEFPVAGLAPWEYSGKHPLVRTVPCSEWTGLRSCLSQSRGSATEARQGPRSGRRRGARCPPPYPARSCR